eukprot:scaffold92327_cov19-Tisochrysis_lutea.AAC.1
MDTTEFEKKPTEAHDTKGRKQHQWHNTIGCANTRIASTAHTHTCACTHPPDMWRPAQTAASPR